MTNMCPECGFEPSSAYGLKIHSRICNEVKKAKGELRRIWLSGGSLTWSDGKLKRWKELTDRLKEMGVDTTERHFFLESRTQARTFRGVG